MPSRQFQLDELTQSLRWVAYFGARPILALTSLAPVQSRSAALPSRCLRDLHCRLSIGHVDEMKYQAEDTSCMSPATEFRSTAQKFSYINRYPSADIRFTLPRNSRRIRSNRLIVGKLRYGVSGAKIEYANKVRRSCRIVSMVIGNIAFLSRLK